MRIGVIQASSQKEKNDLLYKCTLNAVKDSNHEVVNFGIFKDENDQYSYIETALNISLLLSTKAVDFIITGCSSGQGMMLACNSLPGILCGYVQNPQDAFLFGRINDGNAVSFPLGLNFGWSGEINLQCTLDKLFDGPFGSGYPEKDSERKIKDTQLLKKINSLAKKNMLDIINEIDSATLKKALQRDVVIEYILTNGKDVELLKRIKELR